MVFRGNEVGISRHLQSIWVGGGGGVLWKIDCYLTVNQGGGIIRIFQSLREGSVKLCRNTTKLFLRKINMALR